MTDGPDRITDAFPRHFALEGAANFRDIGGYGAADGRRVAWRRFFRSDSLAEITENDLESIKKLGVRTVYDLRNKEERRAARSVLKSVGRSVPIELTPHPPCVDRQSELPTI
jgi:protein-tyrosine phosphatase